MQAGSLSLGARGTVATLPSPNGEFRYEGIVSDGAIASGRLGVGAVGSPEATAFTSELTVFSPIRLKIDLKPGTEIDSRAPVRVDWDEGSAELNVTVHVESISELPDDPTGGGQASVRGKDGSTTMVLVPLFGYRKQFPTRSGPVTVVVRLTPMLSTPFDAVGGNLDGRHELEQLFEFRGLTLRP